MKEILAKKPLVFGHHLVHWILKSDNTSSKMQIASEAMGFTFLTLSLNTKIVLGKVLQKTIFAEFFTVLQLENEICLKGHI